MAKVQRKVVKKGRRQGLSTGMILLILGGAVVVVIALVVLLLPKPKAVAGDPQGLAMCGNIPCPAKGDPNAPVTIIEVSDYGCSHCRDYNRDTEPQVEEQYIKTGQVRYIGHTFHLWPETEPPALAALCANEQGKYWDYHAILFKNQGKFDPNSLATYAQQAGLDVQAFAACVNSGKFKSTLATSTEAAQAAGVTGTPSFFINGKLVTGALPFQCKPGTPECASGSFQAQIEEAMKTGK